MSQQQTQVGTDMQIVCFPMTMTPGDCEDPLILALISSSTHMDLDAIKECTNDMQRELRKGSGSTGVKFYLGGRVVGLMVYESVGLVKAPTILVSWFFVAAQTELPVEEHEAVVTAMVAHLKQLPGLQHTLKIVIYERDLRTAILFRGQVSALRFTSEQHRGYYPDDSDGFTMTCHLPQMDVNPPCSQPEQSAEALSFDFSFRAHASSQALRHLFKLLVLIVILLVWLGIMVFK